MSNRWFRVLLGVVGAVALVLVVACETDTADDTDKNQGDGGAAPNPNPPDSNKGVTENPVIRNPGEPTQVFRWKLQPNGSPNYTPEPRVVTRWPSDLYWIYRCRGDNTYVMVGDVRLDFYAIDRDNWGRKLSYAAHPYTGTEWPANTRATLYRDGQPFAFVIIPNTAEGYTTDLPSQTGSLGDDGYRAVRVENNPAIADTHLSIQQFRYKQQPNGSPNYSGTIPRIVSRWPSDLMWQHGVNEGNSYVVIGFLLMEFYQVDRDNGGSKPSFGHHPWSAGTLPANSICTLFKDGQPFASITIPDPNGGIQQPLP